MPWRHKQPPTMNLESNALEGPRVERYMGVSIIEDNRGNFCFIDMILLTGPAGYVDNDRLITCVRNEPNEGRARTAVVTFVEERDRHGGLGGTNIDRHHKRSIS